MQRIIEPELMVEAEQAEAYDKADFSKSHGARVALFQTRYRKAVTGHVLDLGCGSGDVLERFARAFPAARFTGIDGSPAMLDLAMDRMEAAGLDLRVDLEEAVIPSPEIPRDDYEVIMSHSLLHHLHEPKVLWETIRHHAHPGTFIFVADLRRPASEGEAQRLVDRLAADEPEVLRRDFYNSLCAAFTAKEINDQLEASGLHLTVEETGETHVLVFGTVV